MAETEVSITTEDTKVPGKIVAAGVPSRLEVNIPREKTSEENNGSGNAGAGGEDEATKAAAKIEADKLAAAEAAKNTPPVNELTDDQLKAYFEKQGLTFEGIDKLKEKLTAPVTTPTLTDEDKAKIETEKKNRIVNEHLSRGGTVERFAQYESIIADDKIKLGLQKEVEDLVAMGISQEEATELANERYFQLTDEQIEGIEDPTAKAKALKQREIGLKKLENKGTYIQKAATFYLDILSKDLEKQDAEKIKMEQHTSKVEDAIKKYQRKETLVLGQIIEGQDIAPIDFEYSETALNSAKELLKDYANFTKQLFTKEDDVNLDFILPYFVKAFSMDEAVKRSYLTATDRTIEQFQAKFSSTPPKLGGNGKPTGTPGKLTSFGEKQVFRPTAQK